MSHTSLGTCQLCGESLPVLPNGRLPQHPPHRHMPLPSPFLPEACLGSFAPPRETSAALISQQLQRAHEASTQAWQALATQAEAGQQWQEARARLLHLQQTEARWLARQD